MSSPRITIISFAWPPRNSIAAHRPYSWAKYWSKAGAQVRVITARKYAYDAPLDLTLPSLPKVEVLEIDYRNGMNTLAQATFLSPLKTPVRWIYNKLRNTKLIGLKNPREGWLQAVKPLIPKLAQECEYIVSTYDPWIVHQIAAEMKQINPDLIWIADYRDLWSLNHMTLHTEAKKRASIKHELSTVGAYADLVCSVSEELAEQQGRFVNKPWLTIANGFDIDVEAICENINKPLQAVALPMNIVYTGKIYPSYRDPSPLLEVIVSLENQSIIARGSIHLNIYGGQVEGIEPIMASGRFNHIIKLHGHVSREDAITAQCQADLLLLLESPLPEAYGVLTGKLFEYMATGIPILSLGSRQESAIGRVLEQTKVGLCTEDDQTKISSALVERIAGTPKWFSPELTEILQFSREHQAMKLYETMMSVTTLGITKKV